MHQSGTRSAIVLITVQRSAWGLAMCAVAGGDGGPRLRVEGVGLEPGELDACLRSEGAGYAVDDATVVIRGEWLLHQVHRWGMAGGENLRAVASAQLLPATVVAS